MNEEEKQAIERMKRDYELAKSEDAIDIDIFTEDIKTVLNLLEKKDEEIEKYKMMLAENCARTLNSNLKQKHKHEEDLEALHLGWKEEIEKKDKIINLMSEYISSLDIDEDICMKNTVNTELCNEEYSNCKECIKQYFERKVENGN